MLLDVSLGFLRDWYRNAWILGILLILMGIVMLIGGKFEASTVFPAGLVGWILGIVGTALFSLYFLYHVRWVGEVVGHPSVDEPVDVLIKYLKIFVFFLLMELASFWLIKTGLSVITILLWLLLILFPVAVALDDVSIVDDVVSSVEAWTRSPGVLVEILIVFPILLLTAFFLEVSLGAVGYVLSLLLTTLFTLPLLTTMLSLAYLLRYPLTQRALRS